MKKVNLVFGSVYGNAEFVAESLQTELESLGYQTKLWQSHELTNYIPCENELLILICATTGQGDLPDNIAPWFYQLKATSPNLANVKYDIIALGDSSYETFCGAGKQLNNLFTDIGASSLMPMLQIDATETMEPEVDALDWLKGWHKTVSAIN